MSSCLSVFLVIASTARSVYTHSHSPRPQFVDAHMPSLHINGKDNYQYVLSNLQWSLPYSEHRERACALSKGVLEVTFVSPAGF